MAQGYIVGLPQRLFDANGLPANGWSITTYLPGTTTPLPTYTTPLLSGGATNTNPIVTDASGYFRCYVADGVLVKFAVSDALGVAQADPSFDNLLPMPSSFNASTSYNRTGATDSNGTYTSSTITAPAISSPVITGDAGTGTIFCKQALFTEDATHTIHTATVVIPAGATLLDILVVPQVLWTATSAAFTCGDANSANGWFTSTDLKATDLILGERLQASNANNWGGKNGSYLTTAGRFGQQSTNQIGGYNPTAYSVIGVVTVGTPATTAGRTRMYVLWQIGQSVTPVLT